jgi:hypothetical protein
MKAHPARVGAALAVSAVIALAAPAAPALADAFTLDLAQQSEAVVGRPVVIQATGTIPPRDVGFPYWFSLDAIPTSVTTTCPGDSFEGAQFANGGGGSIVVLTQAETPDLAGNFTIPVVVTPTAPGSLLMCGYTNDGGAITLANAQLIMDIQPRASGPTSGGPRPSGPATYTAQGVRSCRALLGRSGASSCIRAIVRKARARCRRLHSRHARTRCLRAVRRAARGSS